MGSGQKAELTLEEVATRTGESVGRLRRWRKLGLMGRGDAFGLEDVERARLVQLLLRRGIALEAIADWASGDMMARYVDLLFPTGVGQTYSLAEAAEIVGIDVDLLRRVWAAAGFAQEGETLTREDIEGMRMIRIGKDAGFPEEALLQGARVFSDALTRVAEMESRLFHFYVHERLKAEGLAGPELIKATDASGDQMRATIEPLLLYFHRKGMQKAIREDVVLHLAEETGLAERGEMPGQFMRAVGFVDLSSFTPLAEAMGDAKAAEVLERFSAMVRESTGRWDGRVVKQIGDAFMLTFADARSAVACVLEIDERTEREPQFPAARSGIHWGQVLYRDGDYVGSNVNVAARVAGEAQRHQALVTEAVRRAAKDLTEVEFVRQRKRRLKGLATEVDLFEARRTSADTEGRLVDPVCGMEMRPAEVAARLSVEGREHAFCSEECLRRFVAAPGAYSA